MKFFRPFKKISAFVLVFCFLAISLSGCGSTSRDEASAFVGKTKLSANIEAEVKALADSGGAVSLGLETEASGIVQANSDTAAIDYSNITRGYVMARVTGNPEKAHKFLLKGPETVYTYNLSQGDWTAFPLSDGNGHYQADVYESVGDSKYVTILSVAFEAFMEDEFAPFLRPNQYVDFSDSPNTIATAEVLTRGCESELEMVAAVYDFVVENLKDDKQLAQTVQSGYLPVLEKVLESKKGICFDYAALMTGMLRSRGLPCKLVVGYAGDAYHAWIDVWSEESGWIDGVIFFDGSSWQRMDPTFYSTGGKSRDISKFIGDGSNYSAKYFY
mgnify:CR=1 FL=1